MIIKHFVLKIFVPLFLLLFSITAFSQTSQNFNNPANNGLPANTFTVPAGVTSVKIEAWGSGAGGNKQIFRGGGGGAFAGNNSLSVTPGIPYSVTVGLGPAAGSGADGQNSSFGTTLVVAAGGTVGTTEIEVNGGQASNSTGTILSNGGNGGRSYSGGGAGGGGGGGTGGAGGNGGNTNTNSGGAGGAGGTTLGGNGGRGGDQNQNGSTGVTPGGGGGEAGINTSNISGGGGNGRVIVTWTCPTYSLSSTSITSTLCVGNSATVTLTSSTAGLPIGTYTVTYNQSAPNLFTGETTTMSVSTAGTGSFVIPSNKLTNSGATTITITNLSSGSGTPNCSSAISVNNMTTVTVTPNMTVTASTPQTRCISNALTNITHTTTGATGISNGGVSGANGLPAGVSANWASGTITISGTPTASGTFNYSIPLTGSCGSANATGTITVTAAWSANAGPNVTSCTGTTLTGGTNGVLPSTSSTILSQNFDAGGLPSGWGRSYNTSPSYPHFLNTSEHSSPGSTWCGGTSATGNGCIGRAMYFFSYQIPSTITGYLESPAMDLTLHTSASLTFYIYNSGGTDNLKVYAKQGAGTYSQIGSTYTTYSSWTQITISLNSLVGGSNNAVKIKFEGTSDYGYSNIGIDDVLITGDLPSPPTYSWSGPGGFTSSSQNPAITTTGTYTLTVAAGTCTSTSQVVATINPTSVGGTATATASPICSGGSTIITLTGYTGSIQWQTNASGSFTNIPSATSATYTTPALTSTTKYRAIVTSGVCSSSTSSEATVTVNTTSVGGTATATASTICSGGSTTITLTGYTGNIQWQTNASGSFVNVPSSTGATYTTPALTSTTKYRAIVTSGVCSSSTSSEATVTVNTTSVGGTVSGGTTICSGSTSASLSLSGNTGNVIGWESSTNNFTTITTISNTASTYTSGALTQTTQFRAVVQSASCSAAYSTATTVTVNPLPTIAPTTTGALICIGTTTTLSASGAVATERYVWYNAATGGTPLKTSIDNTDNIYTTAVLATTTNYWVSILNAGGCESARSIVTATFPANSPDAQTTAGSDTWIGHVYDGTNAGVTYNNNFTNYYGTFTEPETFDENFGNGTQTCFAITSSLGNRSIYTETFAVRFRMNSTRKGLYVVDLGSDDGSRLTVDGTLIYNNWSDHGYIPRPRVLMSLTGSSTLLYDFYENTGGNRVNFSNLVQILSNTLSTNTTQNICPGNLGDAISGDTYGTLPAGISLSGTGFQWTYSTTLGGVKNNITGATGATFTPNALIPPFNSPGTYYLYRNASVSSTNNFGASPYVATNGSNVATIVINGLNTWTGSVSKDWNTIGNWSCGAVPAISTDVLIPSTLASGNFPTIFVVGASGLARDIEIQSGASITIEGVTNIATGTGTGNALTIAGILTLNGIIDLNGESQLIQSTGSTLDAASTGTIEIDQQGTGNSFRYNYWSSPVNSNGTTYKIKEVLRDGNGGTLLNKNIDFKSPYTHADGVATSPIKLSTYWMYVLRNSGIGYAAWSRVGDSGDVFVGEGYTMKGSNTAADLQSYTFVGKPNNGDITLTLNPGFDYLVGNPYPSAIDTKKFILDNPNTTGVIYFWEHYGGDNHNLAGYQAGYATRNTLAGVPATSPSSVSNIVLAGVIKKIPGPKIAVGQAFFLVGNAVGGQIKFKNSQREFIKESSGDAVFMKNGNTKSKTADIEGEDLRPKFRIGFDAPKISHRQLLIGVDESATNGVDWGFDAEIYEVFADDMYWMLEGNKYVIQGTNAVGLNSEVLLGIQLSKTGLVTVKIDALENVDEDTSIYLKDKLTGESFNMREKAVALNLTAGKYADRFVLVFKTQKLVAEDVKAEIVIPAVGQPIIEGIHVLMNNAIGELQIKNNSTEEIVSVALINALGQTIKSWNSNFNIRTISLPLSTATGVYLVQINTKTGKTVKKISVE